MVGYAALSRSPAKPTLTEKLACHCPKHVALTEFGDV